MWATSRKAWDLYALLVPLYRKVDTMRIDRWVVTFRTKENDDNFGRVLSRPRYRDFRSEESAAAFATNIRRQGGEATPPVYHPQGY